MKLVGVIAVLALLAAACGDGITRSTDPPPLSETTTTTAPDGLEALTAARARWEAAAPADYVVTRHEQCAGCAVDPATLAVRAGEVVSLASTETETIEEVFTTIEESIRGGADVYVEYDDEYGYPSRVIIDLDGDGVADIDLAFDDLEAMPIVASLDELLEAKRRWEAQQLDSYRYIFRADCTCPDGGTFEVEVHNGRVAAIRPLDALAETSNLNPGPIDGAFVDLEQWFVDSAPLIADGLLDVDVRMDPEYGYPRWFRIEGAAVDDDTFADPFTLIVTLDLVGPVDPIEPDPDTDPQPSALQDLDTARARWADAAVTDYRYVVTVHCECSEEHRGPFLITVADGEAVAAVRAADRTDAMEYAATIDEVFDVIALSIQTGTEVAATYDERLGYPVDVILDVPAVAVDGGTAFTISDFEITD